MIKTRKKNNLLNIFFLILLFCGSVAKAATNFVGQSGTPNGNYYTDIQSAVDAASGGDFVLVSNGIYDTGKRITPGFYSYNRILITNSVNVKSVNGPENTIILGKGPLGNSAAVRGVYMSTGILSGFTVSNGHTLSDGNSNYDQAGGAVNMYGGNGIITNCAISGNSANYFGGGTSYGTVNNCTISGNSAGFHGGGSCYSTVNNCTISGNSANSKGGGSCYSTVNNCTISGNSANQYGGGTSGCTVNNCTISGNSANSKGGGTCYDTVNNSTISGNSANQNGGGTYGGTVNNSTISRNSANQDGGGTSGGTINNSIVYYNSAPDYPNRFLGTYNYSCTTPDGTNGTVNISAEPKLVSSSHIATNSPCIGAGSISYISGDDIDGEPWENPPSIGCDEPYANALTGLLSVAVSANETKTFIGCPLTFSADIEGIASLNIWTFGDGTSETNKFEVAHSWSEVGEYDVVVTAFNETYPGGISDSISIIVVTNFHYVNINNLSPVPPYLSWETAATNIQDAVDAALNGGTIFVTNGTYLLSSQIDVNKSLTITSVNGPENTIVDGNNSNRCFYLYNPDTTISGFKIKNGNAVGSNGGGIYCSDTTPVITNCIIIGNAAMRGGGISYGTVNNCTISENSASEGGGTYEGTVNNCTISGNSADYGGGTAGGTVNNCTISWNSADANGGGTLNGTINNSIIYYNFSPNDPNRYNGTYKYCCTTLDGTNGTGNISDPPQFIDITPANYRLQSTSPCINAGTNASAPMPVDLDGNPRIINGTVDMGCYEFTFSAFINITNAPEVVSYYQQTAEISGTNFNIAGNLSWVNPSYDNTTNEFPPGFSTTISNLVYGDNFIQVFGTNEFGILANDFITIHRETWGEFHPFIKIINAPAVVSYYQQTAEISGTNLNIDGFMYWVNSCHLVATNLMLQGFSAAINNLEHGDNIITILGENKYGYPTNDVVSIRRKTLIESQPQIATNALIFPSASSVLLAPFPTNIIWDLEKITDDLDGTNLTITKISVHLASTTNEVGSVTNNVSNLLGEIPWFVPEDLIGGETNYVLKFDVVDSSSLTNSRIFWDNKFIIVPEGGIVFSILFLLFSIFVYYRRKLSIA